MRQRPFSRTWATAVLAVAVLLGGCATTPTPTVATSATTTAATRGSGSELVVAALGFLQQPYRRGGSSSAQGFDCSGFTQHLYGLTLGVSLPRRAEQQAREAGLMAVGRDALQPGDLVFFNTLQRPHSHVGIYMGDGRFIHAPRTGAEVRVENLHMAYWSQRFDGARRAAPVRTASRQP